MALPRPPRPDPPMMGRVLVLTLVFGVLTFALLSARLWQLQMVRHGELEGTAIDQQTREVTATARRGTIFDRNG